MSFIKSIQSLRALTEAPLPPLMDPKILYPEKQRDWQGREQPGYSSGPIMDKIAKMSKKERAVYGLQQLAPEGSSRVALSLSVSANEFTSEGKRTLKDYGVKPSGKIKTVIKLAINKEGISQNTAEIRAWEDTKSYLFVPMLDNSTNQKRSVKIDGQDVPPQYSNWVQTIEVKPFNKGSRDKWIEELRSMFGHGESLVAAFRTAGRGQTGFDDQINAWKKNGTLTNDQLKNLKELVRASKIADMAMIDLVSPGNWGMLGGRLFVIDYGYDASTLQAYYGPLQIKVTVDDKGVLSVDFEGPKEVVDVAREKLKPS